MKEHDFTCILNAPKVTDDLVNRVFDAGCDDGVVASHGNVVSVSFGRQAISLEEAILSAVQDLAAAGIHVVRVETDEHAMIDQLNRRLFAEAS